MQVMRYINVVEKKTELLVIKQKLPKESMQPLKIFANVLISSTLSDDC